MSIIEKLEEQERLMLNIKTIIGDSKKIDSEIRDVTIKTYMGLKDIYHSLCSGKSWEEIKGHEMDYKKKVTEVKQLTTGEQERWVMANVLETINQGGITLMAEIEPEIKEYLSDLGYERNKTTEYIAMVSRVWYAIGKKILVSVK